jgi:hypothetical protein
MGRQIGFSIIAITTILWLIINAMGSKSLTSDEISNSLLLFGVLGLSSFIISSFGLFRFNRVSRKIPLPLVSSSFPKEIEDPIILRMELFFFVLNACLVLSLLYSNPLFGYLFYMTAFGVGLLLFRIIFLFCGKKLRRKYLELRRILETEGPSNLLLHISATTGLPSPEAATGKKKQANISVIISTGLLTLVLIIIPLFSFMYGWQDLAIDFNSVEIALLLLVLVAALYWFILNYVWYPVWKGNYSRINYLRYRVLTEENILTEDELISAINSICGSNFQMKYH